MSRGWFILLAVMIGLNAALLYDKFARTPAPGPEHGGRPPHAERRWANGDPEQRRERMLERHLNQMTEDLGLDDAQREQVRAIRASTFDQLSSLRESTRETRHEIRQLLQAADLDSTRIRELSASLRDDMVRLETLATDNFIREAAVLTPDQRQKHLRWRSFGPRGRGTVRGDRRRGPRGGGSDGPPGGSPHGGPPPDPNGP